MFGLKNTTKLTLMIELVKTKSKNYDILRDGKPIKMKISRSNLPYGFTVKDYGGNPSKNLVISATDQGDIAELHTLEDEVISELSSKSIEIFKKSMTDDEIRGIFNSNVSGGGSLRLKYTKDSRLFNEAGQPLDKNIIDGIFSKWDVTCNYIVSGIYFMNRTIGFIVRAHHVKLFEPQERGCMFLEDTDSD
jgi:hypothetical protein